MHHLCAVNLTVDADIADQWKTARSE